MNEEKLILVVQKYPELWDTSHVSYRDQERKDTIWEEVAKKAFVDKTGDECKKKWFTLRDGYRRSLNKRKTVTGQTRKKIKPYRFEKQMEFLRSCFEERSQLTNFDSSSENDEEDGTTEELVTDETRQTVSSPVASPPPPSPVSGQSLRERVSSARSSIKKKPQKTPVRAAEVLQTYLEKKTPAKREDQLSTFFQSMELNVRNFPHALQIEAKQKNFAIVTELERQALSSTVPLQRPVPPQANLSQNNNQNSAPYTTFLPYRYPQHSQFQEETPYQRSYSSQFSSVTGYLEQQNSQQESTTYQPVPSSSTQMTPIIYESVSQ